MVKLKHENIVSLIGIVEEPAAIIMSLFDCSLASHLNDKADRRDDDGWFFPSDMLFFFKQILQGLHYMHSQGVAHRDLKCANVLVRFKALTSVASLHLTDFGVSKFVLEEAEDSKTYTGTLSWMAPEVVENKGKSKEDAKIYDPIKADIWSFGMVAFEILTGTFPTTDNNNENKFLKEQPADLVAIYSRCTDKSTPPAKRPSALDLLNICGKLQYTK